MNKPEYVRVGDKKYKINTDFRVAIDCDQIARDESISDSERAMAILYKLFGDEGLDNPKDWEELLRLGIKYLSLGKESEEQIEEPDMDFKADMDYIETSFMSDYKVDITNRLMHWWTFYNLICGLSNSDMGNCCVLNRIRNIRTFDVSQIKDPKERAKIIKAKEYFSLKNKKPKMTEQQEKSQEEFYKLLNGEVI